METTKAPMGGKSATAPATTTAAPATKTRTPEQIEKSRQEFKKSHGYFPEDESDEQQFKRLCVPRVGKTLNSLRQLRNLSRLKPSDAYREKVLAAIKESMTQLDAAWKGNATSGGGFSL